MTSHYLSQRPELQSDLRGDLLAHGLGYNEKTSIEESQYERMPLLNAVLSEMMRLEPPLPMTLRKAVRNTSIGGHVVHAGTYIVISPYAMGRSKAIWGPTASTFDPQRWLRPDGVTPVSNQYAMLTFLKGPKGCTGERFAKAEMRRVVAALVAAFEWTPAQEHEPEQLGIVVVKPSGGIAVRLRPICA